ncbi:LPXTG cell wall anchor domain-containing protein [Streptomyces sp. SBST2-5]|uniref:LPXTG cell wall anchor domain-containing protein n=2 Tax=Streptomyces composti TaxID=2720025 RepID=A0ABX1A619_9ACTN|nr:LPXTG cell wall anchor domain-containing protein [Streptomyces composti]
MKLRRAMAAAAATAVIAPVALLAAPAAHATEPAPAVSASESPVEGGTNDGDTSTEPSSEESTESTAPEDEQDAADKPGDDGPQDTTEPSDEESTGDPAPEDETPGTTPSSPAPGTSAPEDGEEEPVPAECEDTKVDISISGLPGKIAAGSGWHTFTLSVANNSDSTLQDLGYFAGASADEEWEQLFKSKQVQVQAYDPAEKVWFDLDSDGYAVGYIGWTDELEPGYEVDIPLRLNVKPSAPAGAAFSFGVTIYGDADAECTGFGAASYRFQIVAPGTDTEGTKPQEGGKAPVTDEKPSKENAPQVTGSLAETGSSSALPVIGLAGGLAVVAGAGAVFVVRRRKAGAEA